MNIYPELKKIVKMKNKIKKEIEKFEEKCAAEGMDFFHMGIEHGFSIKNDKLYQNGELICDSITDDAYFVEQQCGYCEDDYYGTLWFKTNVPGEMIVAYFQC